MSTFQIQSKSCLTYRVAQSKVKFRCNYKVPFSITYVVIIFRWQVREEFHAKRREFGRRGATASKASKDTQTVPCERVNPVKITLVLILQLEMTDGVNSPTKMELGDFLKKQKEQHDNMNVKFSWPDFCKHIPKCILYRASQLRQIAVKGLGQCSYKVVDEFLMFTVELLISEDTLTDEQFTTLRQRAEHLTLEDARTMLEVIIIIREKFSECASSDRSIDNEPNTNEDERCSAAGNVEPARNMFGLVFECKPVTALNPEVLHIVPIENTDRRVDSCSLKRKNEEAQALATNPLFSEAVYEEKLTAYYETYSPVISRQALKDNIIDIIQSDDAESELIDLLGCEALDFVQYIVENQKSIVALNPDHVPRKKSANVLIDELVALLATDRRDMWKDVEKLMAEYVANGKRKEN